MIIIWCIKEIIKTEINYRKAEIKEIKENNDKKEATKENNDKKEEIKENNDKKEEIKENNFLRPQP